MADHPILFKPEMVRALLDGRKTQTRRIIKPQPPGNVVRHCWYAAPIYGFTPDDDVTDNWHKTRLLGYKGDRLWVRETWRCNGWATDVATIFYRASEGNGYTAMCEQYPVAGKKPTRVTSAWRPGIHMPRWASRLTLVVKDVRVQRLLEITREDAVAEGLIRMATAPPIAVEMGCDWGFDGDPRHGSPVSAFAALWNHINGDSAWSENPWVAAYTFDVIKGNIDRIGGAA